MPPRPIVPAPAKVALGLLVAVLLVGLVRMLLEPAPVDPSLPTWFTPVVGSLTFVLLAFLLGAIASGRRWALVLSIVLFVAGLPASLALLKGDSVALVLLVGGQTLVAGTAYVLLLTRSSRQWLRAAREFRKLRARP